MFRVRKLNLGWHFFVFLAICGQIWPKMSATLVHRGLRNPTFLGKKMPTSITFPDPAHVRMKVWVSAWDSRHFPIEPMKQGLWCTVRPVYKVHGFGLMRLTIQAAWDLVSKLCDMSWLILIKDKPYWSYNLKYPVIICDNFWRFIMMTVLIQSFSPFRECHVTIQIGVTCISEW